MVPKSSLFREFSAANLPPGFFCSTMSTDDGRHDWDVSPCQSLTWSLKNHENGTLE